MRTLASTPALLQADSSKTYRPFFARSQADAEGTLGRERASYCLTFIEPGSPWENGYCERLNSKPRDELLDGEIFYSLAKAKIIIEAWRRYYNAERPHSWLGYKPPAPEAIIWPAPAREQHRHLPRQ